jgi:two-component sensor histidine kinase
MFRYPREELIGATVGDLGIWADPEDRQRMVATLREHGHVQDMDTRFRVKGGDVVPARYFTSPITIGGEIHLLSVIQDVTARKAAEEQIAQSLREKEVLLKEIHHRVKNNMQVISSLLSLQSRYLNDARLQEVLKESQQRIRSMALAHEALYRSQNLASIPFGDYARTVVNHLLRSYAPHAVEVDVQTDRYALEVDQAVPAGLILNELVSNTLKHAFPGGRSGHVTVEIRETDSHECRIIVQDDGVGLPADLDIGTTATLGMELVRSLTEQLEGTLVYSGENGTRFEVRFQKSDRS